VPLLWASYTEGQLYRSQNSYEEGLLRLLVSMLPEGVKVIVLADRGFGRTELARVCLDLGVRFLIRIKPDVRVTHPSYTGRLDDYPIEKGMWRVLAGAQYRSDQAVVLNVVIRWKNGLPKRRDEPWFLMTDPLGQCGSADEPVRASDGDRGAVPRRQGRSVRSGFGSITGGNGGALGSVDPDRGSGADPVEWVGPGRARSVPPERVVQQQRPA
jgi:hypothetical protein